MSRIPSIATPPVASGAGAPSTQPGARQLQTPQAPAAPAASTETDSKSAAAAPQDEAKVSLLRQALAEGRLEFDSKRIAQALLQTQIDLLQSRKS